MELMRALGGLGKPMAVVALRNPYELLCLSENAAGIACWEYTDRALAELPAFLKGERPFTGVMPLARSGFGIAGNCTANSLHCRNTVL